ncbi:hypothetical protein V8C44DRAFT_316603 [Trichoderma aethiopicum]
MALLPCWPLSFLLFCPSSGWIRASMDVLDGIFSFHLVWCCLMCGGFLGIGGSQQAGWMPGSLTSHALSCPWSFCLNYLVSSPAVFAYARVWIDKG